uniref:NADH dehydrogenase [ubiquinone] 1 subunit C1, mitochondrial n=1 Tax=Esox lucius TaxID=8010 RepID=A0A3P8ZDV7_ESOLU
MTSWFRLREYTHTGQIVDHRSQQTASDERTHPVAKMTLRRLLLRVASDNRIRSRSMFTARKTDHSNPNWLGVGLAFGSSALLWGLLFKQHSTDVHEYKVRNGLE